jgi:MoaA/NifB/PqqE/SkfB family radical SAM enzyme
MGWGSLKFEDFRNLLAENPEIHRVKFDCFGEVFLNKEVVRMLRYGSEQGISFSFSSANFNHVSDDMISALVECNVEKVTVAFEGITQETYSIYRKRGKLERIFANIEKVNDCKASHGSELPRMRWLWVVFGHNEHEIPQAKALAKDLDMEFRAKLQWDSSYSPVRNPEQLKAELNWDAASREEYKALNRKDYMNKVCHQLWQSPKINWDGRVLGCCWTQEGFGGNAFKDGYVEAINSDRITHARGMLLGKVAPREDIPCTRCKLFQDLEKRGKFLSIEDIRNMPFAG